MNTSLSKFCKESGLPKSSVYQRCKELNFDVTNGLTPSMLSQLEHEFGVNVAPTTAAAPGVAVGNHQIVLAPPQLPAQYSLEVLRTGEAVSFEDPLAVAASFLETADLLEGAMTADIANRQLRLEATQKAKDAIAQKRQKLELEARLYQLQTKTLDGALSAETAALQAELGKLQQFTAPSAAVAPGA